MDKRRGFTIVELLIVIVMIAILAAVTVVAFNGVRVRSQAAAIASDFKAIEKAMLLYKNSLGLSSWPIDTDATYWTGNANPSIAAIITAQPAFRTFMQSAPIATIGTSSAYAFDNDVDVYNGCSTFTNGVNVYITNTATADPAILQAVDDAMDDGNLSCGRVRSSGTSFHYNIARNVDG